jgi:hypothetical protein
MSWNTITTQNILDELLPQEAALIQNLQQDPQNSKLARILSEVINAARGDIIAGGGQLDQPGTIPDQLRDDVTCIARWKWITSLPQLKTMQTPERKQSATEGQERLNLVSQGKIKIELPQNPIQAQAPVNAAATVRPGRRVDEGLGRIGST